MISKYWKDMFILKEDNDGDSNNIIISVDQPSQYTDNKNVIYDRDISKQQVKEEVIQFITTHNITASGNTTLLSLDELDKYLNLGARFLLLRSHTTKKSLIGVVMTLPLPVRVYKKGYYQVLTHGYTTFLNIHTSLQGHGLCMALIRQLIADGYEDGIYCDYHIIPTKIGENSLLLDSWYRPINLSKCINSGFIFPGYNQDRNKNKNRLRYNTRLPPGIDCIKVNHINAENSLNWYLATVADKHFAFYPDLNFWERWTKTFDTYIVKDGQEIVGLFSLSKAEVYIKSTNSQAILAIPLLYVKSNDTSNNKVLKSLLHIAASKNYDVLYTYQYGYITDNDLESIQAIKTTTKLYFSMYNNSICLDREDIVAPTF